MKMASAGFAIVAAHAVGFVVLAARCHGTELAVADGVSPAALADRVTIDDDAPPGPGLHHRRWTVEYRGPFTRSVGAAERVGPFQDPAANACTGRVVVGQRFLDLAAVQLQQTLAAELAGESITGAGDFRAVTDVALRWARLEWHPDDRGAIGEAPDGYVRATATVAFDRVAVPVVIALIPARATTELGFRVVTRAGLAFDNGVVQWISDKLGGDRLATRLARRELDGALLTALAPPPPFDLPGGGTLRFAYCGERAEIIEGVSGALPFAVAFGRSPAGVLPPRRGPAPHAMLAPGAALALDLDLDALNALLHELWRTGYLDRQLAAAGLDRAFNEQPIVQELLTIRMSPVTLALPPVLAPYRGKLRMSADARVTITDGTAPTTGRIWSGLDFAFDKTSVDLGALELSCERTPATLVPCYAELVDVIRGRGADFHDALTGTFTSLLDALFVQRHLGASGLPAELVITKAVPRITISDTDAGANASVHLDLDGELH